MDLPKLRVRVPDGRSILTVVELDGRQIPATRVRFDTRAVDGFVKVRLDFYADIEVEAEGGTPVVVDVETGR